MARLFCAATEFDLINDVACTIVFADCYIRYAALDFIYVVRMPRSMSSTIVPNVPFGPSFVFMNTESITG